jgi:osmoprotectant transport system substrate-binding protein
MKWVVICWMLMVCSCNRPDPIVIGSKNFSEQVILGELLAQHLEKKLNIPVDRKLNLGGTFICHKALEAGQIDLYVEYTGTAYTAILEKDPKNDPQAVLEETRAAYRERFAAEWMAPLGFNNTYAMIIRSSDAQKLGIKTLSESARFAPEWKAGFGYEFVERKDGFSGLSATYGLKFAEEPSVMDLNLIYKALAEKQVDFIAGDSTNGLIAKFDLFILQDDKKYFPPYDAVPVVRREALEKFAGLQQAINELGGRISEEEMRQMNYAVDVEHRDVKSVVTQFLQK